jgi:hypothetical protein
MLLDQRRPTAKALVAPTVTAVAGTVPSTARVEATALGTQPARRRGTFAHDAG